MNIYHRVIYLSLSVLLVVCVNLSLPLVVEAQSDADYVANEVVVKLYNMAELTAVATQYGLQPTPIAQFGNRPIYRMQIVDGEEPPDKAEAMATDSRIQYAEPNYRNSTPEGQKRSSWARVEGVNDYAEQWAADKIRLPAAHALNRGAGMVVAVLDTGIDAAHPALADKVLAGYDFVDMDNDPSEVGVAGQDIVYGHGTHVAGIIAITAPDAVIMPLRILDRNGEGNMWVLAEALGYAINPDGDFATDDGADVINLSLSTLRQTELMDEIIALVTCVSDDDDDDENEGDGVNASDDDDECANRQGTVVVAAAGNSASTTQEYPAAEGNAGLFAVAATTAGDGKAAFSNYGSWVSIGAPGEAVLSAIPGNQAGAWSGTSMASPFVAGVVALVKSQNAQLQPAEIVQQIITSAVNIGGDVPSRVDAAAAIGIVPSTPVTPNNSNTSVCTGTLGAITVENLEVPVNATCTLNGTTVKGNIKVATGAALEATAIQVDGSIQAVGAAVVNVNSNSKVGGSIQLKQGGAATLRNVNVTADIQFESNSGAFVAANNQTGGNLQVFQNTGGATLTNNSIKGNLQCKENAPPPTGGNNSVQGNKEDQCAALESITPTATPTPPTPTGTATPTSTSTPDISGDSVCTGTLGAITVENLEVPVNATCTLNGTTVKGNIKVATGAALEATAIQVDGNLQADGATVVNVNSNSKVGGSIQLKQGGAATLRNVNVTGDIQFESNSGAFVAANNQTGGNLQVFQNTGGATLTNNSIKGNLQCKENAPPPTGGNNTVQGNKEDQCAALEPTTPPAGSPDDQVCTSSLGAVTVDNLTVPANATCVLNGTTVKGNLIVESGATLNATAINVVGHIQAEGALAVNLTAASVRTAADNAAMNSTVGGNIQIKQSGTATLNQVAVNGDIRFESNSGLVQVANNQTRGNLQVFNNTGDVRITDNIINGNLQCQANSAAPAGGNNAVSGSEEDQCTQLNNKQVYLPVITR